MRSEIQDDPRRVAFLYWGRRGLTQFAAELAAAAAADPTLDALISISRQNEDFDRFDTLGNRLFPVDTFQSHGGAIANAWRVPVLQRTLAGRLRGARVEAVIDLMPHVWSVAMEPAIRSVGAKYAVVAHDARSHPGDYRTRWVKKLIDRPLKTADVVIAMSDAVATGLVAASGTARSKIVTLFHPELSFAPAHSREAPAAGKPFRLLFLGRIMTYKGLPLFLDAVDILRREGHPVEVGVFGDGPLGDDAIRLAAMNAEVVNRWLTDAEIAAILRRFDAMVLSHTEASQSGLAASALGAGLPVVATPVGGLVEQIEDGASGVIAARTDAMALAAAVKTLLLDSALYTNICASIEATRHQRSMARFVRACVDSTLTERAPTDLKASPKAAGTPGRN